MGKGDKKSKRGKIIMGSYGVRRQKKSNNPIVKPIIQKTEETKIKSTPKPKENEVVEATIERKTKASIEKKSKDIPETKTKKTEKKSNKKEDTAE